MLSKQLKVPVGLVHGRLKAAEKDSALEDFRTGATRVLVATTVIEVGVDVPEATIMVIERAEGFGLAQLHQLRGRVGRGDKHPIACYFTARRLANWRGKESRRCGALMTASKSQKRISSCAVRATFLAFAKLARQITA